MIKSVQVTDPQNTAVKWFPEVADLCSSWEFTPGLNILWGPNGSGKSTLLRLLARMFHCEQGQDEQKVTRHSVNEMFDWNHSKDGIETISKYDGVDVKHDGSPVVFFDPAVGKGQIYAGHFDDDFMRASIASYMFKGSSGQTTGVRINNIIGHVLAGDFPKMPDFPYLDAEKKAAIEAFLKGTLERDRPTVLLDEPDRSLDITTQVMLWNFIEQFHTKVQFIIASHNLLACDFEYANYITFGPPEYLEACRTVKKNINDTDALRTELRKLKATTPKPTKKRTSRQKK